jgi:hypothetical protein
METRDIERQQPMSETPIYTSKSSLKSLWQAYRIYADRLEFDTLDRRGYVTPQDVKSIGYDVLRHRIIVTYEAEAEDITSENLLQRIFDHLKVP